MFGRLGRLGLWSWPTVKTVHQNCVAIDSDSFAFHSSIYSVLRKCPREFGHWTSYHLRLYSNFYDTQHNECCKRIKHCKTLQDMRHVSQCCNNMFEMDKLKNLTLTVKTWNWGWETMIFQTITQFHMHIHTSTYIHFYTFCGLMKTEYLIVLINHLVFFALMHIECGN